MRPTPRPIPVLAATLPLLIACGETTSGSTGEHRAGLTVAITDRASEELSSFLVDVAGVTVLRADGQRFDVLQRSRRVDLLTLETASAILNSIHVPPGTYLEAAIAFDFTSAEAYLLEETVPASLLDGDGEPLTGVLELPIAIGPQGLALPGGRHRTVELDFDLDQSVFVDVPTNTVFVEPAIALRVDGEETKTLVSGGALRAVDEVGRTLTVAGHAPGRVPELVLVPTAGAVYQIDGVPFTGAEGFAEVLGLPLDTYLQGWGSAAPEHTRLDTHYVEAGRGTWGGGDDRVAGTVVGRVAVSGDRTILSVLGHGEDATHRTRLNNQTFTVTTSRQDTRVLVRGSADVLDTERINVGQEVLVYGSLSGLGMDAQDGVVRLVETSVFGIADGPAQNGRLTLNVVRVGRRPASRFLWSEGGPSPANPLAFVASVPPSSGSPAIAAGTAVELRGLFSPAPSNGEDFAARTVVDLDASAPTVLVHDRLGGQSVQTWASASGIQLNLTGSALPGELAHVLAPLRGPTPLRRIPSPRVLPHGSLGRGAFTLRDRTTGSVVVFPSFAGFGQALADAVARRAQVYNFGAVGPYDALSNTMHARRVFVTVE